MQGPETLDQEDKFVAMMTAKARSSLLLCDYEPRSALQNHSTKVLQPRFPVIDYHNHLDALEPADVLRTMDACGVERVVNITMQTGDAALASLERWQHAAAERFATIGWMDWSGFDTPEFVPRTLDTMERMVERGAVGWKIWKDLGLTLRDRSGKLVRVDDERLDPVFDKARELGIPVMFHTSDPLAFYAPIDVQNERYEELAAHPEWGFHGAEYTKLQLMEQRNNVFARHPHTRFVAAHVGEYAEDMGFVAAMLDRYANVDVDLSARANELGRQPYTAREFFLKYADRILFGADLLPTPEMYRLYYRFLETRDEYFPYPTHASGQGRWCIYGLYLPDDVLEKVYRTNALRLLPR
ncbi:MAG: amidohydrolase family protein [Acidobacteriota bacterium]|nr:amidohydrolase family protein [Acidobacteriota bacterium]